MRAVSAVTILFASAMLSLAPVAANATQWISQLEYKNSAPTTKVNPFGYVLITDGLAGGTEVDISVYLDSGYSLFLDTGNNTTQQPFSFNLLKDPTIASDPNSVVTVVAPTSSLIVPDSSAGPFHQDAFGNFTNALACPTCNGAHGVAPPLVFKVVNAKGLTFAGVGFDVDANNKLLAPTPTDPVTGNRFTSNSGGFVFAADVFQSGGCGGACTFVVGARDSFERITTSVPEPEAWALMILGFGGIGAMARRERKTRLA
jgi:hypothetical protein